MASMNDAQPGAPKVTRKAIYINSFPEQIVAKVKQSAIKPTPISQKLELKAPIISSNDEFRFRKLEQNESARSTWSLLDHENRTEFSGTADAKDPSNSYFLLYVEADQPRAHLLRLKQLSLNKVNTSARFQSLEAAEAAQKKFATTNKPIKPEELGLDVDLGSITKSILNDRNKKGKKGKDGTKKSSKGSSGGGDDDDEFDYDDGEDVWAAADDDEGIQNRDLIDFEQSGDWLGGTKSGYVDDQTVDIQPDDVTEQYFGNDDKDTTKTKNANDSSSDEETSDDDDDDDNATMGDKQSTSTTNGPAAATKRKTLAGAMYDNSDDDSKAIGKRQKVVKK